MEEADNITEDGEEGDSKPEFDFSVYTVSEKLGAIKEIKN